jgi:hypothetical protein
MQKAQIIVTTILLSSIFAGTFGAINSQVTYLLSPEFYTKSLFSQFGFVEYGLSTPKTTAAIIGIWCTWWMGLFIGIVISFTSLIQSNALLMIREIKKSLLLIISSVIVFGFLGYLFGKITLADTLVHWGFSGTQEQLKNFIIAGYIHDFEYIGGGLSAVVTIIFQLKNRNKN